MKERALILLNGEMSNVSLVKPLLEQQPLVLAADGGARHAATLGLRIDCLLGDLDSVTPELLSKLERDNVPILKSPADKDQTDLELCLMHALEQGVNEVHLLGLEGGRTDHLFGIFGIFANETFLDLKLRGYLGLESLVRIKSGENLQFSLSVGTRFSIIPLTADVHGLSVSGAKWPLHMASLPFGSGRGISNQAVQSCVDIRLSKGIILVCVEGAALTTDA